MYIGGVDNRGLHHLLWEVVDKLRRRVPRRPHGQNRGRPCTATGKAAPCGTGGRGIPVDDHPKYDRSALEVILTTLHAGGKFSDKNYARSGGLHGVGSSVVNALSSKMTAIVHRDGYEWVQQLQTRIAAGPGGTHPKEFRGSGTTITFRPGFAKIFKTDPTSIRTSSVKTHLEDIAYIHAGAANQIYRRGEAGDPHEFVQPDGIKAYLEKLCHRRQTPDGPRGPPFTAEKDDGKIKVGTGPALDRGHRRADPQLCQRHPHPRRRHPRKPDCGAGRVKSGPQLHAPPTKRPSRG